MRSSCSHSVVIALGIAPVTATFTVFAIVVAVTISFGPISRFLIFAVATPARAIVVALFIIAVTVAMKRFHPIAKPLSPLLSIKAAASPRRTEGTASAARSLRPLSAFQIFNAVEQDTDERDKLLPTEVGLERTIVPSPRRAGPTGVMSAEVASMAVSLTMRRTAVPLTRWPFPSVVMIGLLVAISVRSTTAVSFTPRRAATFARILLVYAVTVTAHVLASLGETLHHSPEQFPRAAVCLGKQFLLPWCFEFHRFRPLRKDRNDGRSFRKVDHFEVGPSRCFDRGQLQALSDVGGLGEPCRLPSE